MGKLFHMTIGIIPRLIPGIFSFFDNGNWLLFNSLKSKAWHEEETGISTAEKTRGKTEYNSARG